MSTQLKTKIGDHLYCAICICIFAEPHAISCGHTFCEQCLKQIPSKMYYCPLCKQKILKKSQRNIVLQGIIDSLNQSENQEIVIKVQQTSSNLFYIYTQSLPSDSSHLKQFLTQFPQVNLSESSNKQTHLIVGQSKNLIADRTFKLLIAQARGIWIISDQWIIDSLNAGYLLSEDQYEIKSDRHTLGGPRKARMQNGLINLTQNLEFKIEQPAFRNPDPHYIIQLIELTGGKIVTMSKQDTIIMKLEQNPQINNYTEIVNCIPIRINQLHHTLRRLAQYYHRSLITHHSSMPQYLQHCI